MGRARVELFIGRKLDFRSGLLEDGGISARTLVGDLEKRCRSWFIHSFEENVTGEYLIGSKRSGMPLPRARGGGAWAANELVLLIGGRTAATGAAGNLEAFEGIGANRTARGFLVETRDWRTEFPGVWPITALRPTGFPAAAAAAAAAFFLKKMIKRIRRSSRSKKPTMPTTSPTINPVLLVLLLSEADADATVTGSGIGVGVGVAGLD